MLAQEPLKAPTFFTGGFGGVGNVSLMLSEKAGEIAALESRNRIVFRFAQRYGAVAMHRRNRTVIRYHSGRRAGERGECQRPGDDAFQLTDVTWPRISHQRIQCVGGERANVLAVIPWRIDRESALLSGTTSSIRSRNDGIESERALSR